MSCSGLSYPELIARLLALAVEQWERDERPRGYISS